MSFASKWPLPVTHSVFCAPEVVVLSFTLERNRGFCSFLRLESEQVAFSVQQGSVDGGAASPLSALMVKTSFSARLNGARLGRSTLPVPLPGAPQCHFCSLSS